MTAKQIPDEQGPGRLEARQPKLAPKDWKSCPHAGLMDMVVPFGVTEAVAAELKENVFLGGNKATL